MNRTYAFQNAPCCSATSKRTRERCKAPAVRAGRFAASTERAAADQGGNATECSSMGSTPTKPCKNGVFYASFFDNRAER